MKPNYWLLFVGVLLIVLDDCLSMLGLRKLANLLYGNLLERLKKHEPMRTKVFMVVFNAWVNSSDPMLGAS